MYFLLLKGNIENGDMPASYVRLPGRLYFLCNRIAVDTTTEEAIPTDGAMSLS